MDPHFGLPSRLGYGERDALSALVSWDGSNEVAHLPDDNVGNLEPEKMESLGKVMSLVLSVLSRETEY
jgi:hypothetical protein